MRAEEEAERPPLDPAMDDDRWEAPDGSSRPAESQPKEDKDPSTGERTTRVDSAFREVNDSHVQVTGVHHETHNIFQTWKDWSDAAESFRDLTLEDLRIRRAERFGDVETAFEVDEEAVAEAVGVLLRRRIVMVTGERGLGKFAFAQVVAARLSIREPDVRQSLHCSSFSRGLRWRPDHWFDGRSEFGCSIVLFEDLFDGGNLDLGRYFEHFDEAEAGCLGELLEKSGSYLLITTERETQRARPELLRRLEILFEMQPPEARLLVQAMHRRLGLRRLADGEDEEVLVEAEDFLRSHGEALVERLRTFPRAVRFADELLLRVACGELAIDRALDSLDDLETWLLAELPERPLHWSFVLALLLASTDPRTPWVPWLFLHEVWREVEVILAGELRWWRDDEPRAVDRLVVDDAFLESVRAQARRHPYPAGEEFRFADPTTRERLWKVLGGPGRALLALLTNRLTSWSASERPVLRLVGRYVLGRSGELAPSHYVLPRIAQLLEPRAEARGEAAPDPELSQLLTGVATSTERVYLEGCLDRVFSVVKSTDGRRIGPALFALSGIAGVMPEPILDRLERHLGEVLDQSPANPAAVKHRINELATEEPESWHAGQADRQVRDRKLAAELEDLFLGSLGEPMRALLRGTRYLLVGLCLGDRSTAALGRLSNWTVRNGSPLTSWMTLLALHRQGIFETIENFPVSVSYEDGAGGVATSRGSRLLLALDAPADREALATSLENVYERSEAFPLRLRRVMRARLLRRFERWIEQASELPPLREVTVALAHRLLEGDGMLRGDVFRSLRWQGERGEDAGELALEILRGMLPGGGPDEPARA